MGAILLVVTCGVLGAEAPAGAGETGGGGAAPAAPASPAAAPIAAPGAGPAPAGAPAEAVTGLRQEVDELRRKLESESAARAEERKAWEERIQKLEAQLERQRLEAAAGAEASGAPEGGGTMQSLASALNPSLTFVGNGFARVDSKKVYDSSGERIDDQVNLREAEIDARAAVDPYADGVLILSFESAFPGDSEVGVEEGFVTLKSLPFLEKPPAGMKLRAGRFHPAFGKMNLLHTHDLPQTIRPLVISEFLDPAGWSANGGSLEFFIPTPWTQTSSTDLTLQAISAGGASVSQDAHNEFAYLAHLRWFGVVHDAHTIDLGTSGYWGPTERQGGDDVFLGGLDLFYKWKPLRLGEWKSFLVGGELLAARREFYGRTPAGAVDPSIHEKTSPWGYYVMGQYQFGPRLYAGVRWDWTESIENDHLQKFALLPYISYYLSEFLRFRINYQHQWSDLAAEDNLDTVFFEVNFVLGAHPPEPFWVNK